MTMTSFRFTGQKPDVPAFQLTRHLDTIPKQGELVGFMNTSEGAGYGYYRVHSVRHLMFGSSLGESCIVYLAPTYQDAVADFYGTEYDV